MFDSVRTFLSRLKKNNAPQSRRALFLKQQSITGDLRKMMRAYERRLDYLQSQLVSSTSKHVQENTQLFDEVHRELARVMSRLHVADKDAESLLREWRDWLDHHDQKTLSHEAKERLEILRSELMVRGLIPLEQKIKSAPVFIERKIKRSTYQPTALSEDVLAAFDKVYPARITAEHAHVTRRWNRALIHSAQLPLKVWLTKKQKQVNGWKVLLKKS